MGSGQYTVHCSLFTILKNIRLVEDGLGAAAGVVVVGAEHGGEFFYTAVSVQISHGRFGAASLYLLAHMEMGVAVTRQLGQMGDHNDLMSANGR